MDRTRRRRLGPLLMLGPVAAALLLSRLAPLAGLPRTPAEVSDWLSTTRPEDAIAALAGALAWICAGWLAVAMLAALAAGCQGQIGRLGEPVAAVITPRLLRRTIEAALGASVTLAGLGGPTGHALAAGPAAASRPAPSPPPGWPGLDRVAVPPAPSRPRLDRPAGVLVRPGDSLWRIAARALPADATAREIAAGWPAWYAANRRVIGPDPDLLRPGQRLLRPPGH